LTLGGSERSGDIIDAANEAAAEVDCLGSKHCWTATGRHPPQSFAQGFVDDRLHTLSARLAQTLEHRSNVLVQR